jgi:hypothetical protein
MIIILMSLVVSVRTDWIIKLFIIFYIIKGLLILPLPINRFWHRGNLICRSVNLTFTHYLHLYAFGKKAAYTLINVKESSKKNFCLKNL